MPDDTTTTDHRTSDTAERPDLDPASREAGGPAGEHPITDPTGSAIGRELSGLDALETATDGRRPWAHRLWSAAWPKLAAVAFGLGIWQLVAMSGWKPDYVFPGPVPVFKQLGQYLADGQLTHGFVITMRRAVIGFSLATVIGVVTGGLMSQVPVLRRAFGSFVTGLQTMPSIVWFPLAILLFQLTDTAIIFVVVIGAFPSIANGLLAGADNVPPLLLRAGRVLGAKGFRLYREVVLPASLPSFVAGLKQGWAFSWRSLMAGELLVIIASKPSIGFILDRDRTLADYTGLMAVMVFILIIGIVVDTLFFGTMERSIRKRYGLTDLGR